MQWTLSPAPSAPPARSPVFVSPRRLAAAFAPVPDPRRAGSVTDALPAILTLAVVALLSNHLSVLASAAWGEGQAPDLWRILGFPDGRTPCQSTLQRLFRKLDGHALSTALGAHFAPAVISVPAPEGEGLHGVASDGKAQRGRLPFQDGGCPVHALTAFCHEQRIVLAHEPIEQGVEKSEAALTVAPALLARITWPGRVLTGDALFCQRNLCQQVLAAGGDDLLLVKENQPTLYDDIRLLFDPPPDIEALPLLDRREARTRDRGHGRQDEVRHLVASADLTDYLDWPGVAQVCRLVRTWREHGEAKRALHDGSRAGGPRQGRRTASWRSSAGMGPARLASTASRM